MIDTNVPLARKFSLVTPNKDSEFEDGWREAYGAQKYPKIWTDLESEYRVIVLADAGAGKTHEAKNRAQRGDEEGRPSFFIRIEDIDADFDEAFEVGTSEQFEEWLASVDEAWFFLDSVDEARLDNPTAFEKAIKRFAKRIRPAMYRAHIIITSRPYAWRFKSDTELVERHLPFEALKKEPKQEVEDASSENNEKEESPVRIYRLKALDVDDIRFFARHQATPDIEQLIVDIQRANLMEMASRPFDLGALLSKWRSDRELGGRLQSLQHMVDIRLTEIDPGRKERQPLNKGRARDGACRLAAAVTLSNEAGILVPDIVHEKTGIDAEIVLADWENPNDVRKLLERGIFNDILYGAVRFRHSDIRELLAAEWLHHLLQTGNSRRKIESLLFQERYGEQVVVPRFRPILPWLILFDDAIRERALSIHPEIAVEGGDAAYLPLPIRQQILNDIVSRIVADEDDRGARDNGAIARIAQKDLSDDVLRLITEHSANDDAIFFLGRLVWQGDMENCIEPLISIAVDSNRNIYPRIASIRAVATVGSREELVSLWLSVNTKPEVIPRRLLVELAEEAVVDDTTVDLLLGSLDKLPPYEKYETSGLDRAIHTFIDKFSGLSSQESEPLLAKLCVGFNELLNRAPHHQRRECRVSTEFSWLIGPAIQVIERLISDRADVCFDKDVIEILLKIPAIRDWAGEQINEYKDKLHELIPAWKAFNDAYFWRSIEEARVRLTEKDKRLTDVWEVLWRGHYWQFEADSFVRILEFITTKQFEDDQLVALSLAFRIYVQSDRPAEWKNQLEEVVVGEKALAANLQKLLNPPVNEAHDKWEREHLERERQYKKAGVERGLKRAQWIEGLRANPEVVRNPPDVPPGEWTNDQYWLLLEVYGEGLRTSRAKDSNWHSLVDEFGVDVARAFRDSAINHWRLYKPELGSEGADISSTPYSLIFAMLGLEYESREVDNFPSNLSKAEASLALRYLTRELNGFPSWLETMHKAYPEQVLEAIWQELHWELVNTRVDNPMHYILQDTVYHAPWLHGQLTPLLQQWIEENPVSDWEVLRHCFHILDTEQVPLEWLTSFAQSRVTASDSAEDFAKWYALWVDTDPETGIAAVNSWLGGMEPDAATLAAQQFVVQLLGSRRGRVGWAFAQKFKTVPYLTELYVLMHQYIRVEDDIDRAGGGVYSPGLRDDAQDARSQMLNLLTEIPGKETYSVLLDLSQSHPVESHRAWMLKQARRRAEQDADDLPWTSGQIYDFSSLMEREPATHRQLFDLGVLHLNDFKDWLEQGNDSLYATYQKASDETEMRKIVAYWINGHAQGRYTCAQENPLANEQRPDIWLQHPNILSPVPIELKLLDKGWSGPDLCERLRNQLAGDYLREETAGCGVYLLVWKGSNPGRRWEIDGNRVEVSGLQVALTNHWKSISHEFPNVTSIEVIVVDLTIRAIKSDLKFSQSPVIIPL
ncbi:NACHT domain-containing protein [Microbulbifer sp. ZKSA004]|uniref:NACHT domain-containing protein n=1 Tax=Microbulbifer sp. ZKSA004 TaxID=3243389 RepID=UPI0040399564